MLPEGIIEAVHYKHENLHGGFALSWSPVTYGPMQKDFH